MKNMIIILLLISYNAKAQYNSGARLTAMALTGVSLQDIWSISSNQAGIVNITKTAVAIGYERPFADQELNSQSFLIVQPVQKGVLGIGLQKYGFSEYQLLKAGFTVARKFGNDISAAINLNYHELKISGYGSAKAFTAEAGVQYQLNEKIRLGAHVSNPGNAGFGKNIAADLPVALEFGASWKFTTKVLLAGAITQFNNSSSEIKLGVEYLILDWLSLRGGFSAEPAKQYAGFGINFQNLRFDFAAGSNPVIGYSPQVALGYEF
ncbi:MAG: hypothetical protein ABI390_03040 [Daejeonella sp.]